jgi:hypothetical protein
VARGDSHLSRIKAVLLAIFLMFAVLIAGLSRTMAQTPSQGDESQDAAIARFPHGIILILKDGDFKVVREYKINGERVDYFSLEREEWEVIPESLVDWEKTKKVADERKKKGDALVAKIKAREKSQTAPLLDVDASVEVGILNGRTIFLPEGEGLFVFDGKGVKKLEPADTTSNLDKKNLAARVILRKVPIIPTTHVISIQGAHSMFRLAGGVQFEFYLRTTETGDPNLEIIRTVVKKNTRQVEKIDELFGQQRVKKNDVMMQQWQIAPGLYRATFGESITPGEYVIAQIIDGEKVTILLWDFCVVGPETRNTAKQKKK